MRRGGRTGHGSMVAGAAAADAGGPVTGGRQGLYKYVDMDIASEMGISMGEFLLSGKAKQEAIGRIPYEDRTFA